MPLKKVFNDVEAIKPQTPDTWFALDNQRATSSDALLMIRVFDDLYPSADVFNSNYFNINTAQLYLLSININGTKNPLTTVSLSGNQRHNIIATFMIRNLQEEKYETVRTEINLDTVGSGTQYYQFRIKDEMQANQHSKLTNHYKNVEMTNSATSSNYSFRITSGGVTLNRIGNGALPFFSTGNYLGQIFITSGTTLIASDNPILPYTRKIVAYVQAPGGGGAGSFVAGSISFGGDAGQPGELKIVEKTYNQESIDIIVGAVDWARPGIGASAGGQPGDSNSNGVNGGNTSFTLKGTTTAIGGRGGFAQTRSVSGGSIAGKHGQNSMFGEGGIAADIGTGFAGHASGYGASGASGQAIYTGSVNTQRHGSGGSPGCVLIKCYG